MKKTRKNLQWVWKLLKIKQNQKCFYRDDNSTVIPPDCGPTRNRSPDSSWWVRHFRHSQGWQFSLISHWSPRLWQAPLWGGLLSSSTPPWIPLLRTNLLRREVLFSRLSHKRYKRDNIAVRYDLPADIIRNKRDSRYFPGHVPGGVKGITKVNCQGSDIKWMVNIFFTKQWLQQVLSFIQNTVNPIGFEVDEIGRKDSEHHFGDDFVKSPEYILDSDDYF